MMRATLGLCLITALLSVAYGCATQESVSLELSDRIAEAALRLKQRAESETEISYTLTLDVPSLVAIVPRSGIDREALPRDATKAQISALHSSGEMWAGRIFLAIASAQGLDSGPAIERHASVARQLSVLKAPRGTITVRLVRDSSGAVSIAELR